jgi:hypothetical protein
VLIQLIETWLFNAPLETAVHVISYRSVQIFGFVLSAGTTAVQVRTAMGANQKRAQEVEAGAVRFFFFWKFSLKQSGNVLKKV